MSVSAVYTFKSILYTARQLPDPQALNGIFSQYTVYLHETFRKYSGRNAESSSFRAYILRWSVAVSTICRHSFRVVAFLQAVARPKFRGPRSASIARSQVWLGLPAGRFQSSGTCRIHAARARWWSSRGELRAIWPKSRRRLLVTAGERAVVQFNQWFF